MLELIAGQHSQYIEASQSKFGANKLTSFPRMETLVSNGISSVEIYQLLRRRSGCTRGY